MSRHHGFKVGLALTRRLQRMGVNMFDDPRRTPSPMPAHFFLRFVNLKRMMQRELVEFLDPSLVGDAWLEEAGQIPCPNPSKCLGL